MEKINKIANELKNKTKEKNTVLLGDNSNQIRKELARTLRSNGLDSELVETPSELLAKVREKNYLAIITDLEYTPNGNEGYEILKQLTDVQTPKILYTGQIGFETAVEALVYGANYTVLNKSQSELLNLIEKIQIEMKGNIR